MPIELVLLSEVAPSDEAVARAIAGTHPEGQLISFEGGAVRHAVDGDGASLLTLFESQPIVDATSAAAALAHPPAAFGLWTEVTVPRGAAQRGRELAERLASAIGGSVTERV
ncbi:hypothetical protein [Pseudoclavibacter sp. VKM Ac-2867]|uniref:hypothetical protein n=1 Tax=Pseudoclavibacter sp. VKM Ac-2867 TaxID=2783829 RepID=UPI00188A284C|nr:hypothetical protein [Pseudoclavibacter sp. VKM Ac-2867]MBF4457724.1 hypothetical protein [Pseudoclavibacter sp. VKM Ac-2867]